MANRSAAARVRDRKRQFSRVPAERPKETAASFLSRLAWINGRSMADLKTETGIEPRRIDLGEELAIRRMTTLCNMGVGSLARWTPRRAVEKTWTLHGQELGVEHVDRTFFRYCPACLKEDVSEGGRFFTYLRAEWTLTNIRSCDRHGMILHPTSPERRQFEPYHFLETILPLLPSLDTAIADGERVDSSRLQNYLRSRLEGKKREAVWLDALPFHAAADFTEAVGAVAVHGAKVVTARLDARLWMEAGDAGFDIVRGGSETLRPFLRDVFSRTDAKRGVWGARAAIGHVYMFLNGKAKDAGYAPAIDIVREFLLDTVPMEENTMLLGRPVEERRLHTIRTASLRSGAHARTMRKALARAGFVDREQLATTRDNHAVMAAAEVDQLLTDLRTAVTTPAALKRTGIPRLHLRSMIADGYLKTLTRSHDVAYAKHRFSLRDLDDLMDRMFKGAVEVEKPLPRQVDLQRARAIAICSLTDLFRLIFDGKLAWKGRMAGRRDYEALLVDADEVRRMLPKGPEKTGLTKAQVQKVIRGMGQLSVPIFMASGHLESFMETDPITKRTIPVVTVESAEEFRRRYVSLGELCQDTGLHRSQVELTMKAKGIPEVFDKASFQTVFYDRAKVKKAEGEDRAFWRYDKARLLPSLR